MMKVVRWQKPNCWHPFLKNVISRMPGSVSIWTWSGSKWILKCHFKDAGCQTCRGICEERHQCLNMKSRWDFLWKYLKGFLKVSWKFLKCCLKVSWKYLESFLNVAWKFLGKFIFFRTNWILYTPTCCTAEESKICKYEYKMSSCWKSHTMYGKYVSSKTGDCCYKNYGDFFQTRCRLFWHRWIRGLTSHLL